MLNIIRKLTFFKEKALLNLFMINRAVKFLKENSWVVP